MKTLVQDNIVLYYYSRIFGLTGLAIGAASLGRLDVACFFAAFLFWVV